MMKNEWILIWCLYNFLFSLCFQENKYKFSLMLNVKLKYFFLCALPFLLALKQINDFAHFACTVHDGLFQIKSQPEVDLTLHYYQRSSWCIQHLLLTFHPCKLCFVLKKAKLSQNMDLLPSSTEVLIVEVGLCCSYCASKPLLSSRQETSGIILQFACALCGCERIRS